MNIGEENIRWIHFSVNKQSVQSKTSQTLPFVKNTCQNNSN